ncbi:hypothetical protein WDW86_18780 [Bdellovibrionota bacterium FG-2]
MKFAPHHNLTLFALFLSTLSSTLALANEGPTQTTTGFYPIWENTGLTEKHREGYLGTNDAHIGIKDIAQVGVQPLGLMYRTPNAYTKLRIFETSTWHLSAQLGASWLMKGASRSFFSPMYTSRLDNPDFSVVIIPASVSATHDIADWLVVHQSLTALTLHTTGSLANEMYPGYSLSSEFRAKTYHSLSIHVGEVGIWKHDFSYLGGSYRFSNSWAEFKIGYFYRIRPDSLQASPLVSLGFYL